MAIIEKSMYVHESYNNSLAKCVLEQIEKFLYKSRGISAPQVVNEFLSIHDTGF